MVYKAVPEWRNQLVLEVILYYKTVNRKPSELLYVSFDRLQLDNDGLYIFTENEQKEKFRNFSLFAFTTPEILSERKEPLPIPSAVVIPTPSEKECLKNYIKNYLPQLYKSSMYIIEKTIQDHIETNKKHKNLVIEAARIRKEKNK